MRWCFLQLTKAQDKQCIVNAGSLLLLSFLTGCDVIFAQFILTQTTFDSFPRCLDDSLSRIANNTTYTPWWSSTFLGP